MTGFERKSAIIGIGLAAVTAALFYVQLNEMTKQTQILASQSESAAASGLMDGMNTRKQLDILQQQAGATKALAELTAKQFTASQRLIESQRAMISVAFASVLNPVTFHDEAMSVSFAFSVNLKNNGRLPANKVKIRYTAYFSQWGTKIFSEPMERQRDFCSKPNISHDSRVDLKGLTNEEALTILPGDVKELQINFGMGGTDSDIITWPPPESTSNLPQTKRVYPIIVGCVDYQSGVMTEPHQTGFIFEIKRGDPRMPTFITLGEDVRREDVLVEQYFFGQGKLLAPDPNLGTTGTRLWLIFLQRLAKLAHSPAAYALELDRQSQESS